MISREEVLKLAELSRLTIAEEEIGTLQKDISSILEYVGQVSTIDAGRTKEAGMVRNVMREDTPHDAATTLAGRQEALINAFPVHEHGYNVVRKIIQKDE